MRVNQAHPRGRFSFHPAAGRPRIMSINATLRNGIGAALVLALCACGSAPTGTAPTREPVSAQKTVPQLLEAARSALPEQRARYLMEAAGLLLKQNKTDRAEALLKQVSELPLDAKGRGRYQELRARLQLALGEPAQALAILQDPQLLRDQDSLPTAQQIAIAELRAKALALTGEHLASARERIFIDPLLSGKAVERNHRELWRSLMVSDPAELQRYRDGASRDLRGWLELALIAKQNQGNLDQQADALAQWSRQWAAHPAAGKLPADLALLRELAAQQPKQVALLLPLSGKLAALGAAVRDGFMAAWYDSKQRGGTLPVIRTYDSADAADITALYQQAVAEGAQVVVGPLEKQHVAQLYKLPLPVPTLALNRADLDGLAPPNLYQFSLAPEDEAVQIASIAWQQNYRHALVVAADTDTKSRELRAFSQQWESLGGDIAATAWFHDQPTLSQVIKNALGIPRSEARAREMERLLGKNLQFSPRRRQDIDMVFMLAKAQQARSIKPMLAYHYAGDLPVYALSRIYNGYPNPDLDRDLEQVRFTEMPWILDREQPLKKQILADLPQSRNFLRLYAMGVDSFYLYPRLRQLEKLSDSRVYGQTGYLTFGPQLVVQRELLMAEIRDGAPRTLPTALLRGEEPTAAGEQATGNQTDNQAKEGRVDPISPTP